MSLIRAVINDEGGTGIGNALDFPSSLLPDIDDQRFCCLRFVDPYGDTVFNRLQIPAVLRELDFLKERLTTDEQQQIVRQLESFCKMCLDEPHLYLRFIGD